MNLTLMYCDDISGALQRVIYMGLNNSATLLRWNIVYTLNVSHLCFSDINERR